MLIILSAPSGAGKTTLCTKLLTEFPRELKLSISCTTRAPRGAEVHGKEYFFLERADFEEKIKRGEFAEHAEVHGNRYGTLKQTIEDALKQGASVLLDIDVQGADSLRRAYPGKNLSLFISPPSLEILEKRLRSRGTDKEDAVRRRIENARAEMKRAREFDLEVVNDHLDDAYAKIKAFLASRLGWGA